MTPHVCAEFDIKYSMRHGTIREERPSLLFMGSSICHLVSLAIFLFAVFRRAAISFAVVIAFS